MKVSTGLGIKRRLRKVFRLIKSYVLTALSPNKTKVFCIGKNKTGTTSLKSAMIRLGYIVGDQRRAELLVDDWRLGNFRKLIRYVKSAQFFQDTPFSLPGTYKVLDKHFPNSKFILTIRDSPDQWYNSLVKYQQKRMNTGNRIPEKEDFINHNYVTKGWVFKNHMSIFNVSEDDLFNYKILTDHYLKYNEDIMDYFKDRPGDLLVINAADKDAFKKLINFLGVESDLQDFPWKNKT